ncbi:thioesterase II family protein [Piscinibacter terrae]|uniref:Thioesterase n=1 Tax=Piscinibacter terrae TaxID=2496871 RepID=A0A3N7HKM0_9BURK|nr:alpha/beta fold hydrolase [Albitalea terrae]RQP22648.1 thioesterase [Albitalea terrae]
MLDQMAMPGVQAGLRWIKRFAPNPTARIRLLCLPYAGAGPSVFRGWPRLMDSRIEVMAGQLPGREARLREPFAQSAQEITQALAGELLRLCPHEPLAVFGHSMGSILAYDLARRLKEQHGWRVKALIVSGRQPPHVVFGGDFHSRPEPEFIAEIQRLNGTPSAIFGDAEMRNLVLPVLRADYRVIETYEARRGGLLDCPMVSCTSDRDEDAPRERMNLWQSLSSGPFEAWDFIGDHFFLKDQAADLTARLNRYLLAPGAIA